MLISSVWRGRSRLSFIVGLFVGAAPVALVAYALGATLVQWWMPAEVAAAIVACIVVVAILNESGLAQVKLPQNARQVPQQIMREEPWLGALQFGAEMGTGMRTFMTTALPHVLLVCVIVLSGPWPAVAAGVGFAAGRSAVPVGTWATGMAWTDRFDAWNGPVRLMLTSAFVLAAVAVAWPQSFP